MIIPVDRRMAWLLFALLAVGCGSRSEALTQFLPGIDALPGWTPVGEVQVFDTENLYDLVDGQADAFFAYAFESVAVQSYEHVDGATARVEVWQLATPTNAYGLFTTYRAGTPLRIGIEGDSDPGRRLDFWQNRYFVRVFAPLGIPDADLQDLAEAVAGALPADGEPPALVGSLPTAGLEERSDIFFREEISIQGHLWLGGENLLGLGPETEGILASYNLDGRKGQLLLVQYPSTEEAMAGLEALQTKGVDGLVVGQVRGRLLGGVFGDLDATEASTLLSKALEGG